MRPFRFQNSRRVGTWTFLELLAAVSASAQSFNVDLGNSAGTPSSQYAAAGLPGYWNNACSTGGPRLTLRRLDGSPSDVRMEGWQPGCDPDPSPPSSDADALYGDYVPVTDFCGSWTFSGLESGAYEVITHADTWSTLVAVYGGTLLREQPNYVVHAVAVADGTLLIIACGGFSWTGCVYGIQLVLLDCNGNGTPDEQDIASGTSQDCNGNRLPDECETDCNHNGTHDTCDPDFTDCNANGFNDLCEADCNGSGYPDDCDIRDGRSLDADVNGVPDECERTLHVPGDFATIQAALSAARSGDTVLVAAGRYAGSANRELDFAGKAVVLACQSDMAGCTIDAERVGRAFLFDDGEPRTARVDGFTIANGRGEGGGITCLNLGSPTIRRCIIRDCESTGDGGGIRALNASPLIENCVITRNIASLDGGGLSCRGLCSAMIRNCLVVDNWAGFLGGGMEFGSEGTATISECTIANNGAARGGGGVRMGFGGYLNIRNSLLWGNAPSDFPNSGLVPARADYSNIRGGWGGPGAENLNIDPAFADPGAGNYRVLPTSPCVDQGDPAGTDVGAVDLDGRDRVRCGRIDMGAYEHPMGDTNCDRLVGLDDFRPWRECMTGPVAGAPDADCAVFDTENDADVDARDFAVFQRAFSGSSP